MESERGMVERVARALGERIGEYTLHEDYWNLAARIAIETMREPTEAMTVAGDHEILAHLNDHSRIGKATPTPAQDSWAKMIDAALDPHP